MEWIIPAKISLFDPPYSLEFHKKYDGRLGFHAYMPNSIRNGKVVGLHEGRDVTLPKGTPILAPSDCTIVAWMKGNKKNGGWIKLAFETPKGKYFMELTHVNGQEFKSGQIVSKGTELGTVYVVPRIGRATLCIKIYTDKGKPIDFLKVIGQPATPIEVKQEPKKLLR